MSQRGRAEKRHSLGILSELLDTQLAEQAFQDAISDHKIEEKDGTFVAKPPASANGKAEAAQPGGGWRLGKLSLALRAVSAEPYNIAFHGVRKTPDLAATALRQVYKLDTLPSFPSRAEVRCALLQLIVSNLGAEYRPLAGRQLKPFKFDTMSRCLYVIFAGLESGTVMQADAALLRSAFGVSGNGSEELASSIIRLAIKAEREDASDDKGAFNLDRFAQLVRKLAQSLETKPYAGRVAIAQVYDAGLAEGLSLGSLEDFKKHLAEAAREGLLDLERYDIAGPLDAALKERSRLRLGRDERHFIVNQWI